MRKVVEIPLEVMERLLKGKYVEGSLHKDKVTGVIVYNAYNRQPRERNDCLITPLEHGWLKESPKCYIFHDSVKKDLGRRMVDVVMHRELKTAMQALEIKEILDNV